MAKFKIVHVDDIRDELMHDIPRLHALAQRTIANQHLIQAVYHKLKSVTCIQMPTFYAKSDQVNQLDPEAFVTKTTAYSYDNGKFRRKIRNFVKLMIDQIPHWNMDKHAAIVYRCLYDEMDKIVSKKAEESHTQKDFQNVCFRQEFLRAKAGITAPYDVWRRINLCASSYFWEDVTVEALKKLPEAVTKAVAYDLGVDWNLQIKDDEVRFLTASEVYENKKK